MMYSFFAFYGYCRGEFEQDQGMPEELIFHGGEKEVRQC
jgi:hypothetical protein